MQVQAGIRDTWVEVASLKFAVDNISFLMFLLLLGHLVPLDEGTLDRLGDIHVGKTCLVLVVLSSTAWLLALLGQAIIVARTLTQQDAKERRHRRLMNDIADFAWSISNGRIDIYNRNIRLILKIILVATSALGIALVSLALYWIWTRLVDPAVKDAPTSADIECAALVWQIALLVMELQEGAATLLKQHGLTWRGRLKNGLTSHFASGWNWFEAMAFACTLIALAWRQCIFQFSDHGQSLADHHGVNELLTVGILLSYIRVLRAMEVSSRLGPLLSMVGPSPPPDGHSRWPSAITPLFSITGAQVAKMLQRDIVRFMAIAVAVLVAFSEAQRFFFKCSAEEDTDEKRIRQLHGAAISCDKDLNTPGGFVRSFSTSLWVLLDGGSLSDYVTKDQALGGGSLGVSFAWGTMALMLIVITLLMVNLLIAMVRRSEHTDHTHTRTHARLAAACVAQGLDRARGYDGHVHWAAVREDV